MSRPASRAATHAALLAVSLAAPHAAQAQSASFRQGLSAFNSADYARAISTWTPPALSGDREAQSGLGFMYYKGLGVARDYAVAFDWYRRAAAQGQAEAQMFLGALYLYGDGVRRDLVRAWAWCEISQSNGAMGGLGCRDEAAKRMSQADIDKAVRLTAEWWRLGAPLDAR